MKNCSYRLPAFFTLIFACFSITAKAQKAIQSPTEIIVLNKKDDLPAGAVKLGSVKMGDAMRFNCGYDKTLESIKEKAREMKGNAIKLTEIKHPDLWSTCYRMKADVYRIDSVEGLKTSDNARADLLRQTLIPPGAQYALLFVYRPKSSYGFAISYNVHIDTTELRMKNGKGYMLKLPIEGPLTIWTRTEKRKELILDVKFGQVYFVRCGVQTGVVVGVPSMELSPGAGSAYEEYLETDHTDEYK